MLQIVSHLLSKLPLESADAYILLRSQVISNDANLQCVSCNEKKASCSCTRPTSEQKLELAVSRNLAHARATTSDHSTITTSPESPSCDTTDSSAYPPSLIQSPSSSNSSAHVAEILTSHPSAAHASPASCSISSQDVGPAPISVNAAAAAACCVPNNNSTARRTTNVCCDNLDDSKFAANADTTTFLAPTAQAVVLEELCSLSLYQLILEQLTNARATSEAQAPSQALQDTHHTAQANVQESQPRTEVRINGTMDSETAQPLPESSRSHSSPAPVHAKVKRQISLQVLAAKATLLLLIVPAHTWSGTSAGQPDSDDESPFQSTTHTLHAHSDSCGCADQQVGSSCSDGSSDVVNHRMITSWRKMLDISLPFLTNLAGEVQYLREQFDHLESVQHPPKPCLVSCN